MMRHVPEPMGYIAEMPEIVRMEGGEQAIEIRFSGELTRALADAELPLGVYLGMLSASVLVNIFCNMLTIPLWGKMGAAVASVVSYAVAGFVFLGYYLRTYSIPLSAVFVFSPAEKAKLMSKLGAVKRKLGKKKNL